jgi:hypothetical protein
MSSGFLSPVQTGRKTTMLTKPAHYVAVGAVLAACVVGYVVWRQGPSAPVTGAYNPVVDPNDFVPQVNNKYFTLMPGTRFTYQDKMGTLRIEVTVTHEKKKLMGVTTTGVRVREWRNGLLKEDTTDWYAQDRAGNVWYFGEAVNNYTHGKVVDHKGSWEAGVDGAKPGIIMPADPKVRDAYRQEYYPTRAEDMGTVIAIGRKVTVPYGTLENCLQVQDSTPLEPRREYKYYCPGIAFLALEKLIGFGPEAELVSISHP